MTKCCSKFGAMAVTMATVHHKPVTSQLIRDLCQTRRPELSQKQPQKRAETCNSPKSDADRCGLKWPNPGFRYPTAEFLHNQTRSPFWLLWISLTDFQRRRLHHLTVAAAAASCNICAPAAVTDTSTRQTIARWMATCPPSAGIICAA